MKQKRMRTYALSLRLEAAGVVSTWPAAAFRDARTGGFA